MTITTDESNELCFGCVYYPPNLPRHAYEQADWGHAPGPLMLVRT
jgi:hypothetical protein